MSLFLLAKPKLTACRVESTVVTMFQVIDCKHEKVTMTNCDRPAYHFLVSLTDTTGIRSSVCGYNHSTIQGSHHLQSISLKMTDR